MGRPNIPSGYGISGIQEVVPPITITNEDLYERFREHGVYNPKSGELEPFREGKFDIEKVSGVKERRFFSEKQNPVDIVRSAVDKLLTFENVDISNCTDVIVASTRLDIPKIARSAMRELDVPTKGINHACSGFAAAICEAIKRNPDLEEGKHVPIVTAEMWGSSVNTLDRNTVLFGDGVYAFLLTAEFGRQYLRVLDANVSQFSVKGDPIGTNIQDALQPGGSWAKQQRCVAMKGRDVFQAAPKEMVNRADEFLQTGGITTMDDVEFLPHGANMRMLEWIVKRLNELDPETHKKEWQEGQIMMDIALTGNMGASSVPGILKEYADHIETIDKPIVASVIGGGKYLNSQKMTAGQVLLERATE